MSETNTPKFKFNVNKVLEKSDVIPTELLDNFEKTIFEFSQYDTTITKSGSTNYLLFGPEKSRQSINIKMGKILGEDLPKLLINNSTQELEECGILKLQNSETKKDFDLIWINKESKIVYYRECKGNMDLDTEKLPATIEKVKALEIELTKKYPEHEINAGIFNWNIYERSDADGGLTKIKTCEKNGVKVDHFKDFLDILKYKWTNEQYTSYFRKLGRILINIP